MIWYTWVFKKVKLVFSISFDFYIKSNYKSELNKKDYDRIIEIVEKFVKEGGSVELV